VQLGVVVRVQVNEPRRHNQARGIEHFGSVMTLQPAILAILPFLIPMSPGSVALSCPSTTVPPLMIVSNSAIQTLL